MNYTRWYDNNSELKELLGFVEELDEKNRAEFAERVMQILVMECSLNLDEELNRIYKNDYPYKRWYDHNVDLSTALELIRTMPEPKQNYVVQRAIAETAMAALKKEAE